VNPVPFDAWSAVLKWLNALITIVFAVGFPAALIYIIVLLRRIARNTEHKQ